MSPETPTQQLEPQEISAVQSTYNTDHVNRYLKVGWIITAIAKQQNGPESYSVDYHLGWPRHLGEAKQPDLKVHYGSGDEPF